MQQRPRPNRHQRKLTAAMVEFVRGISANTATRLLLGLPVEEDGSEESGAERRRVTARYRREVLAAAAQGAEISLCWHSLAVWTESGKERIGFFSRALDCIYKEREREAPGVVWDDWLRYHMEAESLYEIARVHAHEAAPEAARRFLEQALPLARLSDVVALAKAKPGEVPSGLLEGKIAALLLQLPEMEGEASG